MDNHFNGNTIAGTVGGTFLVVILQADMQELANTAIMAAVGAAVSFIVSVLLKYIAGRFRRK
jgi:mannitol-specific phosphotransferase system IIBC component